MDSRVLFILALGAIVQCVSSKLSCKEIRTFVDGHNYRRLLVAEGKLSNQPPATEMYKMVWDPELENKAQKWASKNLNYHNPDKTVPSGRFSTGENLYQYSTTDAKYIFNPDTAINAWFEEHYNYTYKPLTSSDFDQSKNYQIGHYTQLVWSDSVYLGCAVSKYPSNEQGRTWYNYYVVCNYGPGGNYLGETPYKAGGGQANRLACANEDCNRPYGRNC